MKNCELCQLVEGEVKTEKYYRDKTCTIVDCLTCQVLNPKDKVMLVFNHHGEATDLERKLAMGVIDCLFEYESIRKEPKTLMGHEHWHILGAKYRG